MIALAHKRFDRATADGTFDECVTMVFSTPDCASKILDREIIRELDRAMQDLRDVAEVVGGLALRDDTSNWASMNLTHGSFSSDRSC